VELTKYAAKRDMPEANVLVDCRVKVWVEFAKLIVFDDRRMGGSEGMRSGEFDHRRYTVSNREWMEGTTIEITTEEFPAQS